MPKYRFAVTAALILTALLISSCAGAPQMVGDDWTEETFFKNAQEAMDEDRFDTALYYYNVFLVRYPENHARVIAAEYEKAFISYSRGRLESAKEQYEAIIDKYETSPYAMLYPPRFLRLCRIGLKNIERYRAVRYKLFWRIAERRWAEENGQDILDRNSSE